MSVITMTRRTVTSPADSDGRYPQLHELARAHLRMFPHRCADVSTEDGETEPFSTLWSRFTDHQLRDAGNKVRSAFFGSNVPVCYVELVSEANIFNPHRNKSHVIVQTGNGDPRLARLMDEFARLYLLADRFTNYQDALVCHKFARAGLHESAAALDSSAEKDALWMRDKVAYLEAARDDLEKFYRRAAERRTLSQYMVGMVLGLLIVVPSGIGVYLYLQNVGFAGDELGRINDLALVALSLGGLGAVVSVLLRANSASALVDSESNMRPWWLSPALYRGIFRVILGGLLGTAFAWLLSAGLLPISKDDEVVVAVYGAVGFLAGFSERWARDTVVGIAGTYSAAPDRQGPSTPTATELQVPGLRPTR